MESLLPENSKEKYLITYQNFIQWQNNKNTQSFSENVFMLYFTELSSKYKPSSLWCIYSMLKSTVRTKNGVDLKSYSNLSAYLKRLSDGIKSKKSKVLSFDNIEKFIKEAPDNQYLATKVGLIFGVTGACRIQDLTNITVKDVENHGEMFSVKIPITKNKIPRSFTIHGPFYEIVKKYESLRSPRAKTDRYFQNYQNGKCTCQPIGINKFGSMPKEIAKFLGLADAESYTGHSFRRTSATLLANSEADIMTLKRHDGWQSSNVAESNVKDSILNKKEICAKITKRIKLESEACPTDETPSTSNDWISPTCTNDQHKKEIYAKITKRIKIESEACPTGKTPSTSNDWISPTYSPTGETPNSPTYSPTGETPSTSNDWISPPCSPTGETPSTSKDWNSPIYMNNEHKKEICAKITKRIKLESEARPIGKTTSSSKNFISPAYSPTGETPSQITIEHESISVNNLSEETAMLPKTITYNFTNCTFTNCFSNIRN